MNYYHQVINKELTILEFYGLWPDRIPRLYALTNANENRDGYQYTTGANMDESMKNIKFFIDIQLLYYKSYTKNDIKYIREVSFNDLDNVKIHIDYGKCRTNKLILLSRRLFSHDPEHYIAYLSPINRCLEEVRQDGRALQYIPEQTEEICICAVSHVPEMLYMVRKQTPQICLEAVKRNGVMLHCVKKQTDKIRYPAVKNAAEALEFCDKQTEELCRIAVKKNGMMLRCVKKQTEVICAIALQQNKRAIKYVKHLTPFLVTLFDNILV